MSQFGSRISGFFSSGGGGGGGVTSVGATSPITTSGGTAPTISTSIDTSKLVGRYTSGTGVMQEIAIGDGLTLTGAGILNNTATPTPLGYYGAFYDTTTQNATLTATAYAVKFNTTDLSNGVTIVNDDSGNPTRITIANTGVYDIEFSLQLEKTGGSGNFITDIWLRKNGNNIPYTTGKVVLTGSANASPIVPAWNFVVDVVAGDYYELMWAVSNNNVIILSAVASPPHPSIPSSILTVTQQSGIMAGTGITGLGKSGSIQTGAIQTLAIGTSGTDFNIDSTANTQTFNIPSASASNRGLITTSAQTIAGAKTFSTAPILSSLSASQILATNGSSGIQALNTTTYPSLTELSYVKGTTSAIQTQLNEKQPLSNSAYSFPANNTSGSANMTANTFNDKGVQTYTGTVTWTGTTAPSGTTDFTYRWTQVGKMVTLSINLYYSVAGTGLTQVLMTLPSDCPNPSVPSSMNVAGRVIYYGSGNMTSNYQIGASASRSGMRNNLANNGTELLIIGASANYISTSITITYWTT